MLDTLLAEAPASERSAVPERVDSARIEVGDTLQIFDGAHPTDVNFSIEVESDGTVLMDQLGRLIVAGYSPTSLESMLEERYRNFNADEPWIRVRVVK